MEGSIILIKHGMPELNDSITPDKWPLSKKGLSKTIKFANFVKNNLDVDPIIYSSEEEKAIETATVLADELGLTLKKNKNIGEIKRQPLPLLSEEEYQEKSEEIFKSKGKASFAKESAAEALERFENGIAEILKDPLQDERIIVSHGIVISLFLEKHNENIKGFDVWKKLTCPSYAVVSVPDFQILELNGQPLNN